MYTKPLKLITYHSLRSELRCFRLFFGGLWRKDIAMQSVQLCGLNQDCCEVTLCQSVKLCLRQLGFIMCLGLELIFGCCTLRNLLLLPAFSQALFHDHSCSLQFNKPGSAESDLNYYHGLPCQSNSLMKLRLSHHCHLNQPLQNPAHEEGMILWTEGLNLFCFVVASRVSGHHKDFFFSQLVFPKFKLKLVKAKFECIGL